MNRTLLVAVGLVVLLMLGVSTVDRALAAEPEIVTIDWSGDEVNADANPLARGATPLYTVALDTPIDWSGDEVNADANPLARGATPLYTVALDTPIDWSGDEVNANANLFAMR